MTVSEQAILILVTALLLFSGDWMTRGWKDQAALKAADDATIQAIQQRDAAMQNASAHYQSQLTNAQQSLFALNQKLEAYRAKDHIPADCFVPIDGMSALASAVATANSGRPGPKLPTTAHAK